MLWGRGLGRRQLLYQPIHAVKGRRLVTLRQRGVIEDRVDKVIDRAAESHHRLPDVTDVAAIIGEAFPMAQDIQLRAAVEPVS